MKYKTKNERFCAVMDAYCKRFNVTSYNTGEVAKWMTANGLYPVPHKHMEQSACMDWERRLEMARELPTKTRDFRAEDAEEVATRSAPDGLVV